MRSIREDANIIIDETLIAVLPEAAVIKALHEKKMGGNVYIVAIGKAAWNMASAANTALGSKIKKGIIVTKYKHSGGQIDKFEIIEAGHPVPDENSVIGAKKALELVSDLNTSDQVLFLISGGGSALFEKPIEGIMLEDIMDVTNQLLSCGADIVEINTIRKHLSAVKGGRFAKQCGEANIFAIVLSDVVGDKLDAIASGPAYPDSTTSQQALDIIEKYQVSIDDHVLKAMERETPKIIDNCETIVTGSVTAMCEEAAKSAQKLGYTPLVLTSSLDGEAKEAGKFLAAIAREIRKDSDHNFIPKPPCAIIAGGETIVRLTGNGKGGRNQELALSASIGIEGLKDVVMFSLGSDGTDGPTDAAGGMVDGESVKRMRDKSINPEQYLENNDSYVALKASDDLIITGATGTNVNDVSIILLK